MSYELVEHTADVGVVLRASDLEELFRDAAAAYRSIVAEGEVRDEVERRLELEAEDLPDLLVEFLSELIYLFEAEGLLLAFFDFEQLEPGRLRARARGEPMDPERHRPGAEVKAATYHELEVERTEEGWTARVVLDI